MVIEADASPGTRLPCAERLSRFIAPLMSSWRTRTDPNSIHFALFADLIDSLEAMAEAESVFPSGLE